MKHIILILSLFISTPIFSQNFVMTWNKCYGGTGDDEVYSIISYDNGYLFTGSTSSRDGNISDSLCLYDSSGNNWLVQMDRNGEIILDKIYCGYTGAIGKKILPLNNGFYLTGISGPNDAGITGYWFAKLDTCFNVLWQEVAGGSNQERFRGACVTHDGGVLGVGTTNSNDGDIEEFFGVWDNWLVKMNPDGSRGWIKTHGNVWIEVAGEVIATSDGGYLYATSGYNYTPGNIYCEEEETKQAEGWLIKLNAQGEKEWNRCYGGSYIDALTDDIIELGDGYIVLGYAESGNGDLPGHYGEVGEKTDIWILRTDLYGNIIWSKNYGGSDWDYGNRIFKNDDNTFTILGITESLDYDVQGNNSGTVSDRVVWMIKIDENGNLIYQKPFSEFSFLRGECDFVKVSDYKYVAAVTRYSLDNCYSSPGNQNEDIYIFEIQDMDEFIPSQPIGADEVCVENNAESIYSTQLVVDTMNTQWLLIPEEAGEIINLHDSVRISWNQNYFDTVWLQVRAVNEYGESSYSEAKQILLKDCTGLGESHQKQLKAYPNPASSQITFELPQISKESFLHIQDMYGKTIAELPLFREQTQLVWDCSQISGGVYFYQTQINGEVYRGKIVVN
jgi:hypothetical protein